MNKLRQPQKTCEAWSADLSGHKGREVVQAAVTDCDCEEDSNKSIFVKLMVDLEL